MMARGVTTATGVEHGSAASSFRTPAKLSERAGVLSPSSVSFNAKEEATRLGLPSDGVSAIEQYLTEAFSRGASARELEEASGLGIAEAYQPRAPDSDRPGAPAAEEKSLFATLSAAAVFSPSPKSRAAVSLRARSLEEEESPKGGKPPRRREPRPMSKGELPAESAVVAMLMAVPGVEQVNPRKVDKPWTVPGFPMPRVLVVDDDRTVRHALCKLVVRTAQDVNPGWNAAIQINSDAAMLRKLDDDNQWVPGPLLEAAPTSAARDARALRRLERLGKREMSRILGSAKQVITRESAGPLRWMRREGHHTMVVDRAVDGQFALAAAEAMASSERGPNEMSSEGVNFWDIVLLDLVMTTVDGVTTARRLRQMGFTGVILGQTGNAVESDLARMRAAGADECLRKPVSKEDLTVFFVRALKKRFDVAVEMAGTD